MTVSDGQIFVIDTANHRISAFDMHSLELRATYPPPEIGWGKQGRGGKRWDQLSSPHDICSHDSELFVSDTHNEYAPDGIEGFATSTGCPAAFLAAGRPLSRCCLTQSRPSRRHSHRYAWLESLCRLTAAFRSFQLLCSGWA